MRLNKFSFFVLICIVIALFPSFAFAKLPADVNGHEASLYHSKFQQTQCIDYDESGYLYSFFDDGVEDDVSPLASFEIYDRNSISIFGNSNINTWGSLRMRFGRAKSGSSYTGKIPISYDDYFSLGASFFTDSYVNWGTDLVYGGKLGIKGEVYYIPQYDALYFDDFYEEPDVFDKFVPHSYEKYFSGTADPFKGLDNAITLGYSDAHSWNYWLGADSTSYGSFSDDSSSEVYAFNYGASFDASDTYLNLRWDMGDNNSDFGVSLTSRDTVNFNSAYSNAVASGMEDFYFGLTLDENSLSQLDRSIRVGMNLKDYDGGSFVPFDQIGDFLLPLPVSDLYYSSPVDPFYCKKNDIHYGVYYSLIPVDKNGNELTNHIIGPYLFNTGQNFSDLLDLSFDYKVQISIFVNDVDITLQGFSIPHMLEWHGYMVPTPLRSSSSNATTTFGTDLDFCLEIGGLSGFVVTPTIYAEGVSNSEILDSFNSNFTTLRDLLDSNFEVTISGLNSINSNISTSTASINSSISSASASINSSISSASASINNQLVDSTNKVNKELKKSTDTITEGYDNSEMSKAQQDLDSALTDLDSVQDMDVVDPDGNRTSFFEYIKSVFSSWSWPSFTSEFTNALKEISQLLNTIYSALPEPFQTVIMFLVLFTVLSIVLNFYKYYNSG